MREVIPSSSPRRARSEESLALAREWRRLGHAATVVALLTSPLFYAVLHGPLGLPVAAAVPLALLAIAAFRGAVDIVAHWLIPSPSLYGAEAELADDDVVSRRRLWYWRKMYRRVIVAGGIFLIASGIVALANGEALGDGALDVLGSVPSIIAQAPGLFATFGLLFIINFGILFGPLIFLGAQQIKTYEPGDADWGVKLRDVRGQAEAKEEITRIVSLWQSGEDFVKAGGKRERGVMFLGAPGTGKTMLSKAIATSFNCPFVTIPGSGFAQTFIGMDAVLVRYLARKARKQAAKWGGQCIVFIDEIDAVGMRRQALQAGGPSPPAYGPSLHDHLFFGERGALTPSGDLVVESEAWRERLFNARAPERHNPYPEVYGRLDRVVAPYRARDDGRHGRRAGAQLAARRDGRHRRAAAAASASRPTASTPSSTRSTSSPSRIGSVRLRLRPPKPRKDEIYFIGATNVPMSALDPALVRPGRMGRHVYFRTPTWEDRRDIFDLYLTKVAHEEELDEPARRDELARITNGYSPAMIDQVCSMGLTYAHAEAASVSPGATWWRP